MTSKNERRTWLMTVIVLLALLPAFPLLLLLGGMLFRIAGLSDLAFTPVLTAHNYYYSLPAMIFGESHFPAEEFGVLPTSGGYAVAAMLYALIAIALSFPVCWLFSLRRQKTHAAWRTKLSSTNTRQ